MGDFKCAVLFDPRSKVT